jgi:hypothetical protein
MIMLKEIEWTGIGAIVAFITMMATFLYNRWINYGALVQKQNDYNLELKLLKAMFLQYQEDMKHYLNLCELCRGEVRKHHEGQTAEHVTPALRDQINILSRDVSDIKRFLMEHAQK